LSTSEKEKPKTTLAVVVRDWGQAILIACAIGGGALTFVAKAAAWAKAGPDAIAKAETLDIRLTRVEKQQRFMIRALEKVSGMKYARFGDEAQ
jgi:hypothetical protein